MAFIPLANRDINDIPLVLCGPILRRVEADSVTVWVALKEARKVWLEVYEMEGVTATDTERTSKVVGGRDTVKIGERLHIVAITATITDPNDPLAAGKIYFYNLFFTAPGQTTFDQQTDDSLIPQNTVPDPRSNLAGFETHYEDFTDLDFDGIHNEHIHLPSFTLAPEDLNHVRIVHGSCRKPNAEGLDAMPVIDNMIGTDWLDPLKRPHYLFLTGDQIYADDVSPILLYILMDAESWLLGGWIEELPVVGKPQLKVSGQTPNLLPGTREKAILEEAKYTSSDFKNHLMTATEYLAMYLFVWSDALWSFDLPTFEQVKLETDRKKRPGGLNTIAYTNYLKDEKRLKAFKSSLYQVRRALANVPTYMIFDDHDVTDDWYITHDWCERTLTNDLGRRLVLNGLLSYTLVQAWGNTPEVFSDTATPVPNGKKLLDHTEQWFAAQASHATLEADMGLYLGLPKSDQKGNILKQESGTGQFVLHQEKEALTWHYSILRNDYEIIFLDGRTRRGYPDPSANKDKAIAHADIISQTSVAEHLTLKDNTVRKVTMIVSPTSMINIPAIDFDEFPALVGALAKLDFNSNKYKYDIYDHWKNQSATFEKLLAALVVRRNETQSRNIILTGDVHFSAASRLNFQADQPMPTLNAPAQLQSSYQSIFVQLISSSFKKQEVKTRLLHQRGYKFSTTSAFALGNAFLTKFPDLLAGASGAWKLLTIPLLGILLGPFLVLQLFFYLFDRLRQTLDKIFPSELFEAKLPEPKEFFGWENPQAAGITQLRIPLPPLGPPPTPRFKDEAVPTPSLVKKDRLQYAKDGTFKTPQWRYRTEYILAENEAITPEGEEPFFDEFVPSPGDRKEALNNYANLAKNHLEYARKWGAGKEIVGLNNVSEVFFKWDEAEKHVSQESWWRLQGEEGVLKPFPLTKFIVSLDFDEDNFRLPEFPTD